MPGHGKVVLADQFGGIIESGVSRECGVASEVAALTVFPEDAQGQRFHDGVEYAVIDGLAVSGRACRGRQGMVHARIVNRPKNIVT